MSLDPGSPGKIERLLIVRLSAMGDIIHTLSAARLLRDAFPGAKIGWLVEERWAELLCAPATARRGPRSVARPLVDEVHTVNLKAWGKSIFSLPTLQSVATVWNDVRGAHYDVAIDLQGAIRAAVLARYSGAKMVLGAAQPRESPASLLYDRKIVVHGRHVVEQNLGVARALTDIEDIDSVDVCMNLPRDLSSEKRVDQFLGENGIRDFAILNPGAGWGAKRWPAERFGEVALSLSSQGLRSILNYGPGEENLVLAAEAASCGAAKAMQLTVSELIALTRRARIFIGGDTGPLHLAAALRVPVVGIYGPTDPSRNGPYGTKCVVLRSPESMTSHSRRAEADEGLLTITSQAVAEAARKLLRDGVSY